MSSCNREEGPMAIQLAPLVGAGLGAFQQGKIDKALAGEKTYTKPKTIFGKLIGGISGRTAAAEATTMYKSDPVSDKVLNSLAPSQAKQTPITGGFSFGGEATKRTYLPFYLGAVVLGIFFFMRNRRGGRRRR
jgi:hypothetical protein